jgi:4-hydroxyphenylpyruvate dioxygenase
MQELANQSAAGGVAETKPAAGGDFLPIKGWDHIEFYVGNAKQSAIYYQYALGFKLIGYSGLETGNKEKASYVLEQGKIRFVLSTPLHPDSFIAEHIKRHGDGVRDIALEVDDAASAYVETVKRGAVGVIEPVELKDQSGVIIRSAIKTYGDTLHSFIERKNYNGIFMPGYIDAGNRAVKGIKDAGLRSIDHIVGNVELGRMNYWVKFYADVMGFSQLVSFDDKDISTEYTALMSKVMQNGSGKIKFPINEPAQGKKKSQIDEYLEFYKGAGAQHIAMNTTDIVSTVSDLLTRGVEFLRVPSVYYDELEARVGKIDEDMNELRRLGVLVDRDEDGYLLQLFSKPVEDRPTLFFEIIQRKGAKSFGKGNFKALFEAIEREQELRGTL